MILWLCYDNPPFIYWVLGGLIDGLMSATAWSCLKMMFETRTYV